MGVLPKLGVLETVFLNSIGSGAHYLPLAHYADLKIKFTQGHSFNCSCERRSLLLSGTPLADFANSDHGSQTLLQPSEETAS